MAFWDKHEKYQPKTLLLLAIAVMAFLFGFSIYKILTPDIDNNTYQLIRVESGESYVGRLSHADDTYVQLQDVYVYQADEKLAKNPEVQSSAQPVDNLTLVPVSSIKGTMYVLRDKIVYWGNLSNEGPIVNAIQSNKNKKD